MANTSIVANAERGGSQDYCDRHPPYHRRLPGEAAERTVETTWRRNGELLQAFTSQECTNYLRNAGYASN
jgi:hypothetical protein